MAEVTGRAARLVKLDTFDDLGVTTLDVKPSPDGSVTVVLADPVDDETQAVIAERIITPNDDVMALRATIREALATLDALPPLPDVPTDQSRIARLEAQVGALKAVLHPLVCMDLGEPTEETP